VLFPDGRRWSLLLARKIGGPRFIESGCQLHLPVTRDVVLSVHHKADVDLQRVGTVLDEWVGHLSYLSHSVIGGYSILSHAAFRRAFDNARRCCGFCDDRTYHDPNAMSGAQTVGTVTGGLQSRKWIAG